jgi:hypothetical protein
MSTMPRPRRPTFKLAASAAALCLLSALPASAQVGTYGTQVKVGDTDFTPLVKSNAVRLSVVEIDLGVQGDVRDNCLFLDAATTVGTLQVKDLRLVPCGDKPAGTAHADADVVERLAPVAGVYRGAFVTGLPAGADVVVDPAAGATLFAWTADVNGNAKYDKGDPVYLSTDGTLPVAASTATGAWTLRLTPALDAPAGSLVFLGDRDHVLYGAQLRPVTSGLSGINGCPGLGSSTNTLALTAQQMCTGLTLVEREDKGWYLVPSATPASTITTSWAGLTANTGYDATNEVWNLFFNAAVLRNGEIPVNSIRVGLAGTVALQPRVVVTGADLPIGTVRADEEFAITVRYHNTGNAAGQGVVMTRMDGIVVHAFMTPILAPGQAGEARIKVHALEAGNPKVEVGEWSSFLPVEAAPVDGMSLVVPAPAQAQQARVGTVTPVAAEAAAPGSGGPLPAVPGALEVAVLAAGLALAMLARRVVA